MNDKIRFEKIGKHWSQCPTHNHTPIKKVVIPQGENSTSSFVVCKYCILELIEGGIETLGEMIK